MWLQNGLAIRAHHPSPIWNHNYFSALIVDPDIAPQECPFLLREMCPVAIVEMCFQATIVLTKVPPPVECVEAGFAASRIEMAFVMSRKPKLALVYSVHIVEELLIEKVLSRWKQDVQVLLHAIRNGRLQDMEGHSIKSIGRATIAILHSLAFFSHEPGFSLADR